MLKELNQGTGIPPTQKGAFPLLKRTLLLTKLATGNQKVMEKIIKFKTSVLMIALIWISQSAFGQTEQIQNPSEDHPNSTHISSKVPSENLNTYYSKKEWKKIKRQIRKSKKRITNSKDGIHKHRILDTIYIEINASKTNSQLTNW